MATLTMRGALYKSLRKVVQVVNDLVTSVNEMRTDHLGTGTSYQVLATELVADHATFKTAVDQTKTAVDELIDDHATFKTVTDDLKTLANGIRTALSGDYLWNTVTLAQGSTPTAVSTTAFYYTINGAMYLKAAVTAGTAPGNDVVPQGLYGAVAFDIGADGTIDAIEATDNATGYASAALAAAGLPAVAADHVRTGYVTASKSDGAFTFGTTELAAANTTVAYTSGTGTMVAALGSAVSSSSPATLSAAKPAAGPATLTASVPAAHGTAAVDDLRFVDSAP